MNHSRMDTEINNLGVALAVAYPGSETKISEFIGQLQLMFSDEEELKKRISKEYMRDQIFQLIKNLLFSGSLGDVFMEIHNKFATLDSEMAMQVLSELSKFKPMSYDQIKDVVSGFVVPDEQTMIRLVLGIRQKKMLPESLCDYFLYVLNFPNPQFSPKEGVYGGIAILPVIYGVGGILGTAGLLYNKEKIKWIIRMTIYAIVISITLNLMTFVHIMTSGRRSVSTPIKIGLISAAYVIAKTLVAPFAKSKSSGNPLKNMWNGFTRALSRLGNAFLSGGESSHCSYTWDDCARHLEGFKTQIENMKTGLQLDINNYQSTLDNIISQTQTARHADEVRRQNLRADQKRVEQEIQEMEKKALDRKKAQEKYHKENEEIHQRAMKEADIEKQATLNQYKQKMEEYKEKMREIETQHNKVVQELKNAMKNNKEKLDQLDAEHATRLTEWKTKISAVKSEFVDIKQKHDEVIKQMKNKIQELTKAETTISENVAKITEQQNSLEQKYAKEKKEAELKIEKLNTEKENLIQLDAEHANRLKEWEKKITDAQANFYQMKNKIQELTTAETTISENVAKITEQHKSLEKKFIEEKVNAELQIAILNNEKEKLKSQTQNVHQNLAKETQKLKTIVDNQQKEEEKWEEKRREFADEYQEKMKKEQEHLTNLAKRKETLLKKAQMIESELAKIYTIPPRINQKTRELKKSTFDTMKTLKIAQLRLYRNLEHLVSEYNQYRDEVSSQHPSLDFGKSIKASIPENDMLDMVQQSLLDNNSDSDDSVTLKANPVSRVSYIRELDTLTGNPIPIPIPIRPKMGGVKG